MIFEMELIEEYGEAVALRALRRPMNKSITERKEFDDGDLALAKKLVLRGPDHAKFMRLMGASFTIRAPRYWWLEFSTYRAGVESVSESTMHRRLSEPFIESDFECSTWTTAMRLSLIELNNIRWLLKDKKVSIEELKQRIPEGFLQSRDMALSYQAMRHMYLSRKDHRLPHWEAFCESITRLKHSDLITA